MPFVVVEEDMHRRVLNWLTARFGSDDETEEEKGESQFVPSPLDISVRIAHGMSTAAESEIGSIKEKARELEEQRRDE